MLNKLMFLFIIIIVQSCSSGISRVDGISELNEIFDSNNSFFLNLEKKEKLDLDSLNQVFDKVTYKNKLIDSLGFFFFDISYLKERDHLVSIYIPTGSWDKSGFIYYNNKGKLDEFFKRKIELLDSVENLELDLIRLDDNWVGYVKNKEVPLDILYENNLNPPLVPTASPRQK